MSIRASTARHRHLGLGAAVRLIGTRPENVRIEELVGDCPTCDDWIRSLLLAEAASRENEALDLLPPDVSARLADAMRSAFVRARDRRRARAALADANQTERFPFLDRLVGREAGQARQERALVPTAAASIEVLSQMLSACRVDGREPAQIIRLGVELVAGWPENDETRRVRAMIAAGRCFFDLCDLGIYLEHCVVWLRGSAGLGIGPLSPRFFDANEVKHNLLRFMRDSFGVDVHRAPLRRMRGILLGNRSRVLRVLVLPDVMNDLEEIKVCAALIAHLTLSHLGGPFTLIVEPRTLGDLPPDRKMSARHREAHALARQLPWACAGEEVCPVPQLLSQRSLARAIPVSQSLCRYMDMDIAILRRRWARWLVRTRATRGLLLPVLIALKWAYQFVPWHDRFREAGLIRQMRAAVAFASIAATIEPRRWPG